MVNLEDILDLLRQGKNFSQISRELHCSRNTVKSKLYGYIKTNNRHVPIPNWGLADRTRRRIISQKQNGVAVADIAKEFGISSSYVYKIIQHSRSRNGSR